MKCIGYYSGASSEKGRAALEKTAQGHGVELMLVLCDEGSEFGSFRQVQNLIKLKECDSVLVPSYSALGCDKYMRIENELFIKRNGARLLTADCTTRDLRHDIAVAAKKCVSYLPIFEEEYGLSMPLPDNPEEFRRKLPLGYRSYPGGIETDPAAGEAVRAIFEWFIGGESVSDICTRANAALADSGRKLSNMTVRAVLENRRYLGVQSEKGYHLPPLIRYDAWLEAAARLERERRKSACGELYFKSIFCKKPIRFVDSFSKAADPNFVDVNAAALTSALERTVTDAVKGNAAERLILSYMKPELEEALAILPEAARERNNLIRLFRRDIELLSEGSRSPKLLERIESRADLKNMYGMRLRRIRQEAELFTNIEEPVFRFFRRAANISSLSLEERGLIMNAFIEKVRIVKGEAFVFIKDIETGRLKKAPLPGVVR